MPAAVIGGVIAGAGAIGAAAIGSSAQKSAANKAAQTAQDTTAQNNALQREIYGSNKDILNPYVQTGYKANEGLNALMYGGDPTAELQKSPGYQFRYDTGMNALNTGLAARNGINSGAAMKAAIRYGQDFGSQEYNNRYNQLAQQQGVGLSAGNALAGVGTNFANNISAQNNASASVQANALLAGGQATAGLYGTAANALGQIGGSLISSYGQRR